MADQPFSLFWFRRDLRLEDNAGLYRALKSPYPVQCIFIFDADILDKLEDRNDARVAFIHQEVARLKKELNELGADLWVFYGRPTEVFQSIVQREPIRAVYTNTDYEQYAQHRDARILDLLAEKSITFSAFKDHVIFEKNEVVKQDGAPYTVFTPYSRRWKEKLQTRMTDGESFYLKSYPTLLYTEKLLKIKSVQSVPEIPFNTASSKHLFPPKSVAQSIIRLYGQNRDFPSVDGTSRLGLHYRFGTISVREKAHKALDISEIYINELIWRDFYSQILWHFPHVEKNAFRPEYDRIEWLNDEALFDAWKAGQTGYPLVDAGMRELLATGYMHNRVRMVVASFLTKHLLIDWRWGEAWFGRLLLDFDLASNNGGWQWAAGCGTDAAPYFRIFNPQAQMEKFDPQLLYVKKWVPEYGTTAYPKPIVEHALARERCLVAYKKGLGR